jgi:hypothetical protein
MDNPIDNAPNEFPEDSVIEELLSSSVEFRRFYDTERKKVTRPIRWIQDVSLPEGIDYRFTRLPTGEQIIRLRRVPALIQDACKIAHEIEHFLLDTEGFSSTGLLRRMKPCLRLLIA